MGEPDLEHGDNPGPEWKLGFEVSNPAADSQKTRLNLDLQVDIPQDAPFEHPSPELLAVVAKAIGERRGQDQQRWLPNLDEVAEAIVQYQAAHDAEREEERRQRARERLVVADAGPPAADCRLRRGRGHRDFRGR